MSVSLCTQCGKPATAEQPLLELAGTMSPEPLGFCTEDHMLTWMRANGYGQAADDYTHALWVLEEGIDGFPPPETGA